MEKLINHQTRGCNKRRQRKFFLEGKIRSPKDPFEIPVLTTTNRESTLVERMYAHDDLFYVDRVSGEWDWVHKIESARKMSLQFLADKHEYFIYIDSDDAILWQAPTVALCELALENRDILFQESNHGFPRLHEFGGNKHMVKLFGHKGPCAGAYIARTRTFYKYADIILALREANAKITKVEPHFFDDQAGWKTVSFCCSDRVQVDRDRRFLTTHLEPDYNEIL